MTNRVFICGNQLNLRNLEEEDLLGNYIKWFDNEEVCRHNSHHRFPYSIEELMSYIKSSYKDRNKLILAIIDKKNDIHIGNIALQLIDYINRSAEIAFIIGESEYWGKGYSYEAGMLIIKHGFTQLNLNRIYCGTFSNNAGMQKLAVKLGFKEEGIRRHAVYKDGKYLDIIEYGLLRDEWT